jgi:hypothetical protein
MNFPSERFADFNRVHEVFLGDGESESAGKLTGQTALYSQSTS